MTESTIYDYGAATAVLRPCTEATAARAGQLIAAMRDASADGLPQEHEELSWHGRVRFCIEEGFAAEVVVRAPDGATGAPFAVVLALPDSMTPGRAVLLACESAGQEYITQPAMLAAAKQWSASRGLTLGKLVRVVREDFVEV